MSGAKERLEYLLHRLAEAEGRVAQSRVNVKTQEAIVEQLDRERRDATQARRLLHLFERSLQLNEFECEYLMQERARLKESAIDAAERPGEDSNAL